VFPVGVKDGFELIVVLGLNPCRPYDREQMNHITLLQTTISAGLATVTVCPALAPHEQLLTRFRASRQQLEKLKNWRA